jgi:hypothetical protein
VLAQIMRNRTSPSIVLHHVPIPSLPAQILNKSIGWVSLWGLVYTSLPGVLVGYCKQNLNTCCATPVCCFSHRI